MAYPIDRKLVIGVASSALFDLSEADSIFRSEGEEVYRGYQRKNQNNKLGKGVAFPFIRRFLSLNEIFPDQEPVEVVLLSKNDPDTGLRVFNTIRKYGLNISRAAFTSGQTPYSYIPAFNISLFLSANPDDVRKAVAAGYPAGTVLRTNLADRKEDKELRIAFDFDGVIVDDEAEEAYSRRQRVEDFHEFETKKAKIPLEPGPLGDLFKKLSYFQKLERKREFKEAGKYKRVIRTAIVSARNSPADQRVTTTLRKWGVSPDETFFLGGIEKKRILSILKPHIFFDDQMSHLETAAGIIPSVHIPFGVRNKIKPDGNNNKARGRGSRR